MSGAATRRPRKGEELELEVVELDARGRGVAREPDSTRRVRVAGAVPGQRVRARVTGKRRGALEAVALEVLDRGPNGVAARCEHAASCGGCSLQELAYGAQLEEKRRLLARALAPLERTGPLPIAPVAGCADPWRYRNKMDFTFSSRRWIEEGEPEGADATFALGLHAFGRHDKVLDVRRCEIAFPEASAIVATARRLARGMELSAWDTRSHTGLLRHLVLRKGFATGEVLAFLVTSDETPERVDPFAEAVLAAHPEITTFVHGTSTRAASVAVAERERVLRGTGRIREVLAGLTFEIGPATFFQTNTAQAERLVELVRRRAACAGDEVVYDVCAGAGVLGLALARSARVVVGFELVAEAVAGARRSAEANGVANARFVEGDVARTLAPDALAAAGLPAPDVCVVDPPRAGLHPRALGALRRLAPARLVHVSCNAATTARDLEALQADGYRIEAVEPIDLFPHTPHVECVLTLVRPSGGGA